MSWGAMSSAERDAARVAILQFVKAGPVTREMVTAGLTVRSDPRMRWQTDEARLVAEFKAMLVAATESVA